MKRMSVSVPAALLLSAMLLHAMPAQANKFLYNDVACGGGLKLSHASGIPGGVVHSYVFGGVCSERAMYQKGPYVAAHLPLTATARWDKGISTYSEHLHFLSADTIMDCGGDKVGGKTWCASYKVTTDPYEATFKCDEDPVISKGAHCSLVSQYNGTGWNGFSRGARPLLLGVASVSQARALSKHNAIGCSGLHLTAATGVPKGKKRTYRLIGTCNLYHTPDGSGGLQVTHAVVHGIWDAMAQQAQEYGHVFANTNEGGGGWNIKYTCTDDPWLNGHAKCSRTSPAGHPLPVYDPITDIADRHPVTMGMVNAKQAAQLSEKSQHQKSSAQAGKQQGHSVVKRGAAMGVTRGSAHNLHLFSANLPSPAKPGKASGVTHKMPAPKVVVVRDSYHVDLSCRDKMRLIVVTATVRNDGGPLPIHQWLMSVREDGGAYLGSGGYFVPPLAPHAQATVKIPVWVPNDMVAKLPGTHQVKLIGQGYGQKTTTKVWPPITLPAGICQPKLRMGSPAGMHVQPNAASRPQARSSAGMRMQPKPAAPMRRMSLPAVQLNR